MEEQIEVGIIKSQKIDDLWIMKEKAKETFLKITNNKVSDALCLEFDWQSI